MDFLPKKPKLKKVMNSSRLRRLIDMGISVEIKRADGSFAIYHPSKSGKVVVSFSGEKVCMYCGKDISKSVHGFCKCQKEFHVTTLTGAYRFINAVQIDAEGCDYDPRTQKLKVSERTYSRKVS